VKSCIVLASALDDAALGVAPNRALSAHLATCTTCTARLERRRSLARRIDSGVEAYVRVALPPGLPDRIDARASMPSRSRRRAVWLGVPAVAALAVGVVVIFLSLGGTRTSERRPDIAAIAAWRSPTASLLVSRSNVLEAPFSLRGVHVTTARLHS
jgi:anti-sigma factor RsiW